MVPINKSECCGCTACMNICPTNAISMKNDSEGFVYPSVDTSKCINCGLCDKNCSFFNKKKMERSINTIYVAKHKNLNTRMNSRSGAVFVASSDWILQNNGVIYGCILDNNMYVKHIRADNITTRNLMCKSKYAQSDISNIINQIITDLNNNLMVLFTGTGCQIEGLLSVLKVKKIDYSKLYTIDLICHGCASPLIFNDYIKYLEKKHNGKITSFDFRDKTLCGWDGYIESYIINNYKYKSSIYREIFNTDLCIRPSCYNCKYCTTNRNSDITIGDAWGIKKSMPNFNDNRGVSIFIIQSQKGSELFEQIQKDCDIAELPIEKMLQPNLKAPSKPKGNREEFWKIYYECGIEGIIDKYGKVSLNKKFKSFFGYRLRKIIQHKKYYLP